MASSSLAEMMVVFPGRRRLSVCADGGMPVMDSSLFFKCEMVQDGLTRLSEEAALEVIRIGMSRAGARELMMAGSSRQ